MREMNEKREKADWVPAVRQEKVEEVITAGSLFMDKNVPDVNNVWVLMAKQLRYLSPSLWGCQLLLLCAAIAAALITSMDCSDAGYMIFTMAPVAGFLTVPEMLKDLQYNMSELESVCRYDGAKVLVLRFISAGLINVLCLTMISAVMWEAFGVSFLKTVIYGLVPYVWVNVINLFLIMLLRIRSRRAGVLLSVMPVAALYLFQPENMMFYDGAVVFWLAALAAGVLLGAGEVCLIMKEKNKREGAFLWN